MRETALRVEGRYREREERVERCGEDVTKEEGGEPTAGGGVRRFVLAKGSGLGRLGRLLRSESTERTVALTHNFESVLGKAPKYEDLRS